MTFSDILSDFVLSLLLVAVIVTLSLSMVNSIVYLIPDSAGVHCTLQSDLVDDPMMIKHQHLYYLSVIII